MVMNKEIIIYTMSTCSYCEEIKKLLNEKNIKFTEKDKIEFAGEWYQVAQLTGMPMFPTICIRGEYFIPNRDFQNPTQLLNLAEYMISEEYKEWDIQTKIYEKPPIDGKYPYKIKYFGKKTISGLHAHSVYGSIDNGKKNGVSPYTNKTTEY